MKFLSERKTKQILKIFEGSQVNYDSKFYYVNIDSRIITSQQTKQLEKKRLRIESIEPGEIKLRRKIKTFDWFVIYSAMRISIGALMVFLGVILI